MPPPEDGNPSHLPNGDAGPAGRHDAAAPLAEEASSLESDDDGALVPVGAAEGGKPTPARLGPARLQVPAWRRDPVRAFVAEARRHGLLGADEERAVAARARAGDREAVRTMVVHNLRLVVSIAYQYRRAWANILDLFQEGSVGLMEAIRRWEPALGSRFGTYATYWIRAYVLKFIMTNSRLIHVGNTRAGRKLFFRLERERQRLIAAGFEPTTKLLAANLDVAEEDLDEVGRHLASREVSTEYRPGGAESEGPTLGEGLSGDDPSPEDAAAREELAHTVRRLTETFAAGLVDARERDIWREHLAAVEPVSLAALAERHGISKQRMGQLAERLKRRFRELLEAEMGPEAHMQWREG